MKEHNVRSIMKELHILPAPNKEHKKVFHKVPVVTFRNCKNHKNDLVRVKLSKPEESGRWKPCSKKNPESQQMFYHNL